MSVKNLLKYCSRYTHTLALKLPLTDFATPLPPLALIVTLSLSSGNSIMISHCHSPQVTLL